MLYQQLDHPLVPLLYSMYEGRVSILYRIGKDRIRVEKKKRGRKNRKERERERTREEESQRNMGET